MVLKKENGSDNTNEPWRLTVDQDMTIYAIDNIKQEISKQLDVYDSFEFDLAQVEEIDSAGIQLLLAFKSELERNNKKFKLVAMSNVVAEWIENYGISARLNYGENA